MAETRGIRNNNPFNIKRGSSRWLGKVPHQASTDKVFEQFTDIDYGLRAGIVLIHNYMKQGFDTYRNIISRFAPSSENNVDSYIKFVCRINMGWNPDAKFEYKSLYFWNLVHQICVYESNYNFTFEHYKTILHKFNL